MFLPRANAGGRAWFPMGGAEALNSSPRVDARGRNRHSRGSEEALQAGMGLVARIGTMPGEARRHTLLTRPEADRRTRQAACASLPHYPSARCLHRTAPHFPIHPSQL
jgi:hypothetical protein